MRTLAAVLLAVALPCQAQVLGVDSVGFPAGTLPFGQLDWASPVQSGGLVTMSATMSPAGCYATPYNPGGASFAITRATVQTRTSGSVTCNNAEAAVETNGISIWRASAQLYPTPSAPAAGTVTFAATGAHTFSVIGSGSQTLTAAGTLVATGLPCTATAAVPCRFTVSSLGATPTGTLSAVTGSLTFGQVEAGSGRTPQITAVATRNVQLTSTAWPKVTTNWCVSVKATPTGRNWWTSSGIYHLVGIGTNAAANSALLWVNASQLQMAVYDSGAANKQVSWTITAKSDTEHTATGCVENGVPRLYWDGSPVQTGALAGAGTGTWSANPATMYLGIQHNSIRPWDGNIKSVRVCKTSGRVASCAGAINSITAVTLGDSLTQGNGLDNPYASTVAQNIGPGFQLDNLGLSGYRANQTLTQWTGTVRAMGKRRVSVMVGLNDIFGDGATAAATWTSIKQVVDEAVADGAIVFLGNVTPVGGAATYSAPKEAERQTLNTTIANYCNGSTIICWDASTAVRDPGTPTQLLAAYDSGDHVHPNQAGADALAATLTAVWR